MFDIWGFTCSDIFPSGADALSANHCVQAAEHEGWQRRRQSGCQNGASTLQIELNCMHHQGSLAKKPALLAIDGLCSSMVRFARAMRSSKFQDQFKTGLDDIASRVDRRVVVTLPDSSKAWKEENRFLCDLVCNHLNESDRASIVNMFNGHWADSFENTYSWVHFCDGCCLSREDAVRRARECLRILFERFPQVPLLYRWKGWEPCQNYVAIGVLLHGFLQYLVKLCCDPKNAEKIHSLLEQDEDHADFSYAMRQEVRIGKTVKFVTADSILVDWL